MHAAHVISKYRPILRPIMQCLLEGGGQMAWLSSAARMRRYKVTHTLDEVFEAHPVVKRVLCDEAAINATYVGGPCVPLSGSR